MSLTGPREPTLTVDGELLVGQEALQVPVTLRTDAHGDSATIELEAQQVAASNRTVRLADLSASQVRQLRDEFDDLLQALE